MSRIGKCAIAMTAAIALASIAELHAQSSGGQFTISASVIAGGGSPISGGSYQITSTLGQPATAILSSGGYVVVDGFWAPVGGVATGDVIFANGFD
jgi:hypothetical protein